MQMEAVVSSLISHRGYDPAKKIMLIRFASKTAKYGSLYEYGNVEEAVWDAAIHHISDRTNEISFGQFFQKHIKDQKEYPFRKLEDPHDGDGFHGDSGPSLFDDPTITVDVTANGQQIPATTAEVLPPLPTDEEELKREALALQEKAKAIVINSVEAYSLAETVGVAIARMRDALEKTMRPKINQLYAPYKAALGVLNFYDKPLETDQKRLKDGMSAFKRAADAKAQQIANAERSRLQAIEDERARERAQELKLEDAIAAEQRGEPELVKTIMESPALEVAAKFVPPVPVQSEAPKGNGSFHVEKWEFEYVDIHGNPIAQPDFALIPRQYLMIDEKAIAAAVKRTKARTDITGIRAYDAGDVRFKKKA